MYPKIKLLIKNILKIIITSSVMLYINKAFPERTYTKYLFDESSIEIDRLKGDYFIRLDSLKLLHSGIAYGTIGTIKPIKECCEKDTFTLKIHAKYLVNWDESIYYMNNDLDVPFDDINPVSMTIKIKKDKELFNLLMNSLYAPLKINFEKMTIDEYGDIKAEGYAWEKVGYEYE